MCVCVCELTLRIFYYLYQNLSQIYSQVREEMLKMVNIGLQLCMARTERSKANQNYCYSKVLKTCEGFFLEDNIIVVVAVFL